MDIEIPQQTARNFAPVKALGVSQQKCEELFHVHGPWRAFYMPDKPKYPLPCGCAGPKYISKCAGHQELDREQHHEALTGAKMKADNARLLVENEALRAQLAKS